MNEQSKTEYETEEGVIYADHDQLSLIKRYVIVAVDSAVLVVLGVLFALLPFDTNYMIMAWLTIIFLYLVVLKHSRIRTLGYRIMRARIVDLHGNPPSYVRMIVRLCVVQMSVGNPLFDFFWSSERNQRTMRDKIAGTYVIRANAQVLGRGPIRTAYFFVLGYSIFFREVGIKRDRP